MQLPNKKNCIDRYAALISEKIKHLQEIELVDEDDINISEVSKFVITSNIIVLFCFYDRLNNIFIKELIIDKFNKLIITDQNLHEHISHQ